VQQEERDHQFGRLFGAESIIESRILFQPHIDTGVWGDVLGIVCALAVQKWWLREECGFVLFKALQATAKDDSTYAQSIIDKLRDHNLLRTPEGIVIWITAKRELPSLKFPAHVWKHENPLDRKETSSLARILREGAIVDTNDLDAPGSKMTQQSIWSTKVHFAWDSIIAQLSYDQPAGIQKNSKGTKNISFEEFWEECVDSRPFRP